MDLLHEEKEPIEWRSLQVGVERGVNSCEHMQALLTNLLQSLPVAGRSPDRLTTRYKTVFMARKGGDPFSGRARTSLQASHPLPLLMPSLHQRKGEERED